MAERPETVSVGFARMFLDLVEPGVGTDDDVEELLDELLVLDSI